jgi:PrcB C-terminal
MTMKSDTYMRTLIWITLLASAFLSFSASAWTPYNYQVVELSGVPYFDQPIHLAIRTREEWLSFTKRRSDWPEQPPTVPGQHLTAAPRPPISVIDFDRYSLVIIGIGARTGYQLAVSEIRETPDEVWVRYAVIRPGTNCAVAQVVGHPSLSILIPKTIKLVRFYETAAAMDCSSFKNDPEMRQLLEKE